LIHVLLAVLAIVVGGQIYEVLEGREVIVAEDGVYTLRVGGEDRVRVWLPRGFYNVSLRTTSLDNRLEAMVVILSNTSSHINTVRFDRGVAGYDIYLEVTIGNVASCKIEDIRFYSLKPLEELRPFLKRSVRVNESGGICRLIIDSARAPGWLHVDPLRPPQWVSITLVGSGFTLSIAYGVERASLSPRGEGGGAGDIPIKTPQPIEEASSLYVIPRLNYLLIIGLLVILLFSVVAELAGGERGSRASQIGAPSPSIR